jgi:hypothetical protein
MLWVEWVFRQQHPQLRSASLIHPFRAELEIKVYSRDHLESLSSPKHQCRAMPISLFIDGFGVHRNTYRSLKAFYITLASLSYAERRKVSNIFTSTFTRPDIARFSETNHIIKLVSLIRYICNAVSFEKMMPHLLSLSNIPKSYILVTISPKL